MEQTSPRPRRTIAGRFVVGLMCVGLLILLFGLDGMLLSLVSFGLLVPVCWLLMEWRTKRWRAAVIGVLSLACAFFLGWAGAAHCRSLEESALMRTLQQAQEYLQHGNPEGLQDELSRCMDRLRSSGSAYRALLHFRGPYEESRNQD